MKLISRLRWLAYALFLSVTAVAVAQDATCPTIVQDALAATDSACAGTGRNEACYGNISLSAKAQPGISDFTFTKPGDLVNVAGVQTLTLSPLDQKADTWGVALMKLQANLPDTLPGQNVTFLLFGDVEIQNAVTSNVDAGTASAVTLPITVSGTIAPVMNLSDPSQSPIMLKEGDKATADGRDTTTEVLHVQLKDGKSGWIPLQFVEVEGDVSTLPATVDLSKGYAELTPAAPAPQLTPMQAFYFKSGTNDAPCKEAPDSGILIQTPEGAGKIDLVVNDAKVTLGSTGYFQAQPGGDMRVTVVEGEGTIAAGGKTVTVPAGTYTTLPVDDQLKASGQPTDPQPYDASGLAALPISILPKTIAIAPALEVTEVVDSGAAIAPRPGTWTSVSTTPVVGAGCPPGMAAAMANVGGAPTNITMPEGVFDPQAVMNLNDAQLTGPVEIAHPEPNLYTLDYDQSGAVLHYEFHLISETEIDLTMTGTVEGCEFTVSATATATG
ncbi:MAG: hypothetical protein ABI690_21295 [Chloroflexota bacterium]